MHIDEYQAIVTIAEEKSLITLRVCLWVPESRAITLEEAIEAIESEWDNNNATVEAIANTVHCILFPVAEVEVYLYE